MPPLGFIGTVIGMVVHFLSNSGSLNSNLTVAGIVAHQSALKGGERLEIPQFT